MPVAVPAAYEQLVTRAKRMGALRQSIFHLEWDQHTFMPPGGTVARAEEISTLSALEHETLVAPETGRLLTEAERVETDEDRCAILRELRFAYDRATKVPVALVEELSRATSEALPLWADARRASDFARFRPMLERLVELRQRQAEHVDPDAAAYAVLFHDYEPWIPLDEARRNLTALREGLRPLIHEAAARDTPRDALFDGSWPVERQVAFTSRVIGMLGYDFERGRLDASVHPFSTGNAHDARITTRFDERTPTTGLLAAIHETGHALYTQGLPKEHHNTPLGDARDVAVHESQSRLWENHVGRSLPFWEQVLPVLREQFPGALPGASAEDAWRAVNDVRPTYIRVDADELTYHMHVALRFEIEEGLISGSVRVREVPEVWNDLSEKYLAMRPPDDARGCLQDMHWSSGYFGYFPTYSLGSMLSAQLHATYLRETKASPTDHPRLRAWLQEKVHRHGKRYKTGDLIERATGGPLAPDAFLAYAKAKYAKVWA